MWERRVPMVLESIVIILNEDEQKGEKMKKTFITVISMQGETNGESDLLKLKYESPENQKLKYNRAIRYPITAAIHAYANKEDDVRVIAIKNLSCSNLERNFGYFMEEMNEIKEEKGFPEENFKIEEMEMENLVGRDFDIELFERLVEKVEREDSLYICITFGQRSTLPVLFMVANYLEKVKQADIQCILYGNIERKEDDENKAELHDLTYLYYRNLLFHNLADLGHEDPIGQLNKIEYSFDEEE